MNDVVMGCFGSVLCYSDSEAYCLRCPLKEKCAVQVAENRSTINEKLGIPDDQQFWHATKRKTTKRERQLAMVLSDEPVEAVVEAAPAPTPRPVAKDLYEASQLTGLPVKVQQELTRWMTKGVDLSPLASGINPFSAETGTGTAEMIVRTALRMGVPGKRALAEEIADTQRLAGVKVWTMGSLQSNINIVATALAACGYTIIKEGK